MIRTKKIINKLTNTMFVTKKMYRKQIQVCALGLKKTDWYPGCTLNYLLHFELDTFLHYLLFGFAVSGRMEVFFETAAAIRQMRC